MRHFPSAPLERQREAASSVLSHAPAFRIGTNAEIDANVLLGYLYPDWSEPAIIGDNAVIRSGSVIYADSTIGDRFTCGHNVIVRAKSILGNDVVLLHQTTLEGNLRIGSGVKIMSHVYLSSTTSIGDFVFVGPGVNFLNSKYPMRDDAPVCGATISAGVCIGGGVTICPGITIGEGAFIGAGSVVTRDVPPHTLAMGVPAKCQPLPEGIPQRNLSEKLLGSADLWGKKLQSESII